MYTMVLNIFVNLGYGANVAILVLMFLCNCTDASTKPRPYSLDLANQFLTPHNAARSALGMPPLVWDLRLTRYAESYANYIKRNDCAFRHSNGPYGENIFWGSGNDWTPVQAVTDWVSERRWYNHWTNSCSGQRDCGHYTQIVWSRTKRIGCAKVTCYGGKGIFITCNYDPPGNYIGEKPY